jgi:PQQ-dependent catabolism-associated CXXCW motif protein
MRRLGPLALGLAFGLAVLLGGAATAQTVPEPDGYRMDDYKSPTPATVKGGIAITTAEAKAIWDQNIAVWIDVLPVPIRPPGLAPEQMWAPKPRKDVPGSVWLPEVGRGALNAEFDAYFRKNLDSLTHGNLDQPIVLYCLADCWMSWNAVKRAASYGYRKVYWYRDGTDGWAEAGNLLEPAHVIPLKPEEETPPNPALLPRVH